MTRRVFLALAAGSAVYLPDGERPAVAGPLPDRAPSGPVYGRTGPLGIPAGTARAPSRGEVILLDGRVFTACHTDARAIEPGRSVLITPDDRGAFSLLYAEV
jgi:hypothetical protein